jgi:DNA adenine methylase
MKPLIKWSGGKSKELPIVHQYKPNSFNVYHEPFIGGGALWLNLNHNKNVVSDNFVELIEFYNTIKEYKQECIDYINNVALEYNGIDKTPLTKEEFGELGKKYYYHYRDNEFTEPLERALKFYVLRQLSFSGMLRFSKAGKYNIPFGWYKNMKVLDYNDDLFNLLDNTDIICGDWKSGLSNVTDEDFVFFDPPYTRKFQTYSPYGVFGETEHLELSEWFKSSPSKNMIILNKDDFTYPLYKDYIVDEYDYKYSIQYRDRMKHEDSNTIHFVAINYEKSIDISNFI